jgi:hypothetical protein
MALESMKPALGACRGLGLYRLLDQVGGALRGEVNENGAYPEGAAIGRDLRVLEPDAVGVPEEVVSRLDRAIHARRIERRGSLSGKLIRKGEESEEGGRKYSASSHIGSTRRGQLGFRDERMYAGRWTSSRISALKASILPYEVG